LTVTASTYWNEHYTFSKLSRNQPKILGDKSVDLLILNFAIPFLFFFGEEKALGSCKAKGLEWLEKLPGEVNAGMTRWKSLGLNTEDALHTQALIHLKMNYCDRKRCLECRVGNKLLKRL
jgi:hypothetical protein